MTYHELIEGFSRATRGRECPRLLLLSPEGLKKMHRMLLDAGWMPSERFQDARIRISLAVSPNCAVFVGGAISPYAIQFRQ